MAMHCTFFNSTTKLNLTGLPPLLSSALPPHKGLSGGSRATTIFSRIMLLNGAEMSRDLNSGIYGSRRCHLTWPTELILQISTLKTRQITILNAFLHRPPQTISYRQSDLKYTLVTQNCTRNSILGPTRPLNDLRYSKKLEMSVKVKFFLLNISHSALEVYV